MLSLIASMNSCGVYAGSKKATDGAQMSEVRRKREKRERQANSKRTSARQKMEEKDMQQKARDQHMKKLLGVKDDFATTLRLKCAIVDQKQKLEALKADLAELIASGKCDVGTLKHVLGYIMKQVDECVGAFEAKNAYEFRWKFNRRLANRKDRAMIAQYNRLKNEINDLLIALEDANVSGSSKVRTVLIVGGVVVVGIVVSVGCYYALPWLMSCFSKPAVEHIAQAAIQPSKTFVPQMCKNPNFVKPVTEVVQKVTQVAPQTFVNETAKVTGTVVVENPSIGQALLNGFGRLNGKLVQGFGRLNAKLVKGFGGLNSKLFGK